MHAFGGIIPRRQLDSADARPMRSDSPLLVRDVLDLFHFFQGQSKVTIGGFIVQLLSESANEVGGEAHALADSGAKVHKLHDNSGKGKGKGGTLTSIKEVIRKRDGLESDAFTRFCAMPFLPVVGWRAHQAAGLTAEENAAAKKRKALGGGVPVLLPGERNRVDVSSGAVVHGPTGGGKRARFSFYGVRLGGEFQVEDLSQGLHRLAVGNAVALADRAQPTPQEMQLEQQRYTTAQELQQERELRALDPHMVRNLLHMPGNVNVAHMLAEWQSLCATTNATKQARIEELQQQVQNLTAQVQIERQANTDLLRRERIQGRLLATLQRYMLRVLTLPRCFLCVSCWVLVAGYRL
jgi:hypothetical protein